MSQSSRRLHFLIVGGQDRSQLPGGGGVLPYNYKCLMWTFGQPGYVFRDFCLNKQGIEFIISCLNQGIDLSIFVLNRMSFLGR